MYTIDDSIERKGFKGLQLEKLVRTDTLEILSISLEKDFLFPDHRSPKDAQLIVLEGDIDFHINEVTYHLTKHFHFNFPKEETHWVKANENSKFLIIR